MSRTVLLQQRPDYIELGESLTRLCLETLSFEVDWIRATQPWPAHGTHGWRSLPSLLVLVAISGGYQCVLENGVRFATGPHEALVLPAGVPHWIDFPQPGRLVAAHLNFRVLGGIDVMRFFDLAHQIPRNPGKEIGRLLEAIARNRQARTFGIAAAVQEKALGFQLLALVLQHAASRRIDVERLLLMQRLARVLEEIHERIEEPLSIRELCRHARLSRQRFFAVFKQAFGFAPKEYVSRAKIQRAKQLLISRDLTIANVSDRLGYCNPYHFSRQFKALAGVSPSVYRRRIFEYES